MKTWLLRAGQLALTLLVTWFTAQRLGLDLAQLTELDAGTWRPDWIVFAASCIVLLTGMLLSGALWGRVVSDLSGVSLPVSEAIRIFLVANLARYVPGKLWQLAGLAVLASRRGVPASAATASAVVAHGASLTAASILGALVLMGGDTSRPAGLAWVPLVLLGVTLVALLPPVFRLGLTGPEFPLTTRCNCASLNSIFSFRSWHVAHCLIFSSSAVRARQVSHFRRSPSFH